VVEDESIVAFEISNYLESLECHVVAMVTNGVEALEVLKNHHIDLVIMDIFLDGNLNGIETALTIKQEDKKVMIIFLTANSDNHNINQAIEVEPLVYLSKPFNRKELYASINMAKSRLSKSKSHMVQLDSEFSFDLKNSFLYSQNQPLHLTKKESELLSFLIKNRNSVVSNSTIEYALWPNEEASDNKIRTLIQRLRKKLNHKFIETIPKRGYIFRI
jgi:DNA-binding response OmpR family regulator